MFGATWFREFDLLLDGCVDGVVFGDEDAQWGIGDVEAGDVVEEFFTIGAGGAVLGEDLSGGAANLDDTAVSGIGDKDGRIQSTPNDFYGRWVGKRCAESFG